MELKSILPVVFCLILLLYIIRHVVFCLDRSFSPQKVGHDALFTPYLPSITIMVPMHNEELVVKGILDCLKEDPFITEKCQVICINDHSIDNTGRVVESYIPLFKNMFHLERQKGERGKPAGLNEALEMATGEIILIFDADYLPSKGLVQNLAKSFLDPEVGCVMGRVVAINEGYNLVTQFSGLERAAGYQVDQQARYNLGFVCQYGGTVGGFRKQLIQSLGGFNPKILAEDTDLTFKATLGGWKVHYANSCECYEEAPESWRVRARQIQRWSRGHNYILLKSFFSILKTPFLNFFQRVEALLLLMIYAIPAMIVIGFFIAIVFFFLGEPMIPAFFVLMVSIMLYFPFGNFSPFYQIATALILDGKRRNVLILPLMIFQFIFSIYFSAKGFFEALMDFFSNRKITWNKTVRFRK